MLAEDGYTWYVPGWTEVGTHADFGGKECRSTIAAAGRLFIRAGDRLFAVARP